MSLHRFSMSGSCNNAALLEETLSFVLSHMGIKSIKGSMMSAQAEQYRDDRNVLVFCTYKSNNNKEYMPYPIEITSEPNDVRMLASHILNYIRGLSDDDLEKLGAAPSGYEEEYEIGWRLFTPDWFSEDDGIKDYSLETRLAVKPILIEYGK